jgi:hypothetical protein
MRSRIETGRVLREGTVPVTEFRAGVIAGSGSISFEMIRFMTELFPIVPGPLWMRNRSQPIAMQNVIDYLFAALTNPNGRGGVFEIGGPDITTYGDLMLRYARLRGLKRSMFLIPGIPVWFMAFGVGLMTPVPYPIAHALIGGLSADSIVKYPEALRVFPEVTLIDFETAAKDALAKTQPGYIERVWDDGRDQAISIKHEGCFIDHREIKVNGELEKVWSAIKNLGARVNQGEGLGLMEKASFFGMQWIEWRVGHVISQTVFFCPHGLPGFLYWFLLYPFHMLKFRGLIHKIKKQSEIQ